MKDFDFKLFLFLFSLFGINHVTQAQSLIWAKRMGGTENETGSAVAIDNLSNVITIGSFQGLVDFDPGEDYALLNSEGGSDAFISKLDAQGNVIWAKQFGGYLNDAASGISIDDTGNIFVVGSFEGAFQAQTSSGLVQITSNGSLDIFISKYDSSGNLIWIKTMGGNDWDQAFDLEMDADGNIFITGYLRGQVDLDPGPNEFLIDLNPNNNNSDIFILKLNANGDFIWGKGIGNDSLDEGYALAIDPSGSVIMTGAFRGTVDFDPGHDIFELTAIEDFDTFIVKLDASGNFEWGKSISSGNNNRGYDVAADTDGNICVVGYFSSTADFDPGSDTFELSAFGYSDIYVLKLLPNGSLLWAKQIGGTNQAQAFSVAIDNSNNIYLTGYISGTIDADPGFGNYSITSQGIDDIIIEKLDEDGMLLWAHGLGSGTAEIGYGLAVDENQQLYCTGYFSGPVDFDPSPAATSLLNIQNMDIFILKWGTEVNSANQSTSQVHPITVFPNPGNGHFRLSFEGISNPSTTYQIFIYNAFGQVVLSMISTNNSPEIDLSAYPSGIYILKAVHARDIYSAKLIVE